MIAINVSVQQMVGSRNSQLQKSLTVQDETNVEELKAAFDEADEFMAEARDKFAGKKK